jgi:hypothetical protein
MAKKFLQTKNIQIGEFSPKTQEDVFHDHPQSFWVNFPYEFETVPQVQVSFNNLDLKAGEGYIVRARVHITKIEKYGFEFQVVTWCDSKIYFGQTSFNWLAIAQ